MGNHVKKFCCWLLYDVSHKIKTYDGENSYRFLRSETAQSLRLFCISWFSVSSKESDNSAYYSELQVLLTSSIV
jgi:hypothetical protein